VDLASVAVILLAKYPTAGRVKTRLMPALTAGAAAAIQQLFLTHMLQRLEAMRPAELVLCFDPPDMAEAMARLPGMPPALTYLPQCAGDLGHRLAAAAEQVGCRHRQLLFFGVDSPDVPSNHIGHAAALTRAYEVSLSPSADGGYWSLGLQRGVDAAALLRDIPWSSGREARQTVQRAEALGYRVAQGEPWEDVDRPEDLRRLMQRLEKTGAALAESAGDEPAQRVLLRELKKYWTSDLSTKES
jgi:rSAM/selenodomain-associated transferase 1